MLTAFAFIASVFVGAAPTHREVNDIEFIGFSRDESHAAWLLHLKNPHPESDATDVYSLVRVAETRSNRVVRYFRASGIRRVKRGTETTVATPRGVLRHQNPSYASADSQRAWVAYSTAQQFAASPFDATAGVVRVTQQRDVHVKVRPHAFVLRTTGSRPFYKLQGVLAGGSVVDLGKIQASNGPRPWKVASVYVYRSISGFHVAVLTRYGHRDSGQGLAAQARVYRQPGHLPLANSPRNDDPRSGRVAMMLHRERNPVSRIRLQGGDW